MLLGPGPGLLSAVRTGLTWRPYSVMGFAVSLAVSQQVTVSQQVNKSQYLNKSTSHITQVLAFQLSFVFVGGKNVELDPRLKAEQKSVSDRTLKSLYFSCCDDNGKLQDKHFL